MCEVFEWVHIGVMVKCPHTFGHIMLMQGFDYTVASVLLESLYHPLAVINSGSSGAAGFILMFARRSFKKSKIFPAK